jgi:hypothetical protein
MSRRSTWFRMLAALLAGGHLLLLGPAAAPPGWAQESAAALYEAGVEAYRLVEMERAELLLRQAAQALAAAEAADPQARQLAAQVHLYLGRVAVVAGRGVEAREHFREALRRAPGLVMVTETDPPKIVEVFDEVRGAMPAPPAASAAEVQPVATAAVVKKKKKRWLWWTIGGAAVVLTVLPIVTFRQTGGGGDVLDLAGNWTYTAVLQSNTCGVSNGSSETVPLVVRQSGSQLTLVFPEGEMQGTTSGRTLSFSGTLTQSEPGCLSTYGVEAQGNGDAQRLSGTQSILYTQQPAGSGFAQGKLLPPCEAGQCTSRYSFTMSRR